MVYAGVVRGAKRENVLASQVRIRMALSMAICIAGAAFHGAGELQQRESSGWNDGYDEP